MAVQSLNVFALPDDLLRIFTLAGKQKLDEDCLYLNVWTSGREGAGRPVLFWCHGGAFITGSGSSPWSDGANLCRLDDVVVVSFNHRLGALGYLHLEDMAEGFEHAGPRGRARHRRGARMGARQHRPLRRRSAATSPIFGESGGGAKVSVLMAMPPAKGLFHKAIIQSGPAVQMANREDGTKTARQMLEHLGLDAARCRQAARAAGREAPRSAGQGAGGRQSRGLRRPAAARLQPGDRRRRCFPAGRSRLQAPLPSINVPLMIGSNKDEMTLFLGHMPWVADATFESLPESLTPYLGARGAEIVATYRKAQPRLRPDEIAIAIVSDQGIRAPSLLIAERKLASRRRARSSSTSSPGRRRCWAAGCVPATRSRFLRLLQPRNGGADRRRSRAASRSARR